MLVNYKVTPGIFLGFSSSFLEPICIPGLTERIWSKLSCLKHNTMAETRTSARKPMALRPLVYSTITLHMFEEYINVSAH